MAVEPVGVLLMAYGAPATSDDIAAYYTHIRGGRPPTTELLRNLRARYEAIGGASPLLERTRAQAEGLQRALGEGFRVELGMKHAPPFIEDGVARLAARGVRRAVGLVLAPHYSTRSVGEYAERALVAAAGGGIRLSVVSSWHLEPGYVGLLARYVSEAVATLSVTPLEVVFTAHSLPTKILVGGDPYANMLRQTAAAVARRAGLRQWSVGWQSAGRTDDEWIGPDILDVLRSHASASAGAVLVCPAGFVSDHLEVLYDLDMEARALAASLGVRFARTPMPNDDPTFCATLADVVRRRARGALGPALRTG